ncbi:Rqc2 family fibronectin-binding protein [Vampirovibrio chlorellavorus]|uniref:Rqc2 family fibronectin-binding protein n=1 Tax=Vampirovibrio chlorellavorus TaxID=758823 RepID=UPI0026ED31DE|nr:NFACT family protein [Vampirovibrio chlorellavorus]
MQQLDALSLKALALELDALLRNAKVSKVQHPSPHEFLLTFWGGAPRPEQLNLFYIQLSPEAPFCVLTRPRVRQDTVLNSFAKPTALCMLLRKHLQGANLSQVKTLPGERVLNLVFENLNELGEPVRLVLSLELMGKHTNMIFYDDARGEILAVAHGVGERMSSHRELAAGLPYAPPPQPAGKRLMASLSFVDFAALLAHKPADEPLLRFLNANLAGFGLRMLEDAWAMAEGSEETLYGQLQTLDSVQALQPVISGDGQRFGLLGHIHAAEEVVPCESVNALVERYFIGHLKALRLQRRREQLLLKLDQREKRRQSREKELTPVSEEQIGSFQATGDRLLSAFSAREVPAHPIPGQTTVILTHYDDGSPWPIEIDPAADWVENAQLYYRRAKKAKARQHAAEQMLSQLNEERDYLASLWQLVSQAETLAEFDTLEAEMIAAGFINASPKLLADKKQKQGTVKTDEKAGVLTLQSSDGLEILVGKSAQGNDAIVGKLSRSDDWWLHVHQMPGSHVLIRSGKEPVPDNTLLEAAMLAVYYSSARHSLNVPVIYTACKYVRKIPQSYPGHVNYRQEQTLFVSPQQTVIDRLLVARG